MKTTVLKDEIQRLRTYPSKDEKQLLDDVIDVVMSHELAAFSLLEEIGDGDGNFDIEVVRDFVEQYK